jgi:hypothetical protein
MGAGRQFLFSGALHREKQAAKALAAPKVTFRATPLQVKWMEAISSGLYTILGIGGGIRGTKTFACISALIVLCRMFPRSRWAIVRTDLQTIRRNVIPSMEKLRLMSGGFVGELNQSIWTYTCANGSQIILFAESFDTDKELDRWKGLEVNGFDLEEANELNEKSANKAIERAGSWIIPATDDDPAPRQPPPLVLCNFNPCANWPRRWFYEPWRSNSMKKGYFFLPATIADNPYATDAYKESLKNLPEAEYNRFVKGEWDFVDDPDQLIKSEWVWAARNVEPDLTGPGRIGADIARFGDDNSSIYRTLGNTLVKTITMRHFDTIRVGTVIVNEAVENNVKPEHVKVDVVGLGAGSVDYARTKLKFPLREFVAGGKPVERNVEHSYLPSEFRFYDLRSQAWYECREKLRTGKLSLFMRDGQGQEIPLPEKLVGDLSTPRYEITRDKVIKVESKTDIKARLGRSTDDGDAYVMAVFDMPEVPRDPVLGPGSMTFVDYGY